MKHKIYNCPIEATLEFIGGKYKTIILWHLIDNILRYSELRKLIPQATPKMLTQQLRELEENGLIKKSNLSNSSPKSRIFINRVWKNFNSCIKCDEAMGKRMY